MEKEMKRDLQDFMKLLTWTLLITRVEAEDAVWEFLFTLNRKGSDILKTEDQLVILTPI